MIRATRHDECVTSLSKRETNDPKTTFKVEFTMARFILGLAVVACLSLLTAGPVLANNKSGGHSSTVHNTPTHQSFNLNQQHSPSNHSGSSSSFRFRQSNWGSRSWNATYGC